MEIKFEIPAIDLEIIYEHIEYLTNELPRFKIISDNFLVHDETFSEYNGGATMFDWKEVVMEIDSLNNFWALSKIVAKIRIDRGLNIF